MELAVEPAKAQPQSKPTTHPEVQEPQPKATQQDKTCLTHIGLPRHEHRRAADWPESYLVERLLARDNLAWREFLRRYRPAIVSAIRRVIVRFEAVLTSDECDEIFGELMIGLQARNMHKLRAFEQQRGVRLTTWLNMLARNAAWDRLRRLARNTRASAAQRDATNQQTHSSPEVALIMQRRARRAAQILGKLPRRERQLYELQYLDERNADEIATAMRISVSSVYTKRHKLLARLRACAELS